MPGGQGEAGRRALAGPWASKEAGPEGGGGAPTAVLPGCVMGGVSVGGCLAKNVTSSAARYQLRDKNCRFLYG